MNTTIEESKYPDDIMNLELTHEIKSIEIVSIFMSSFNSMSVIVQLNHKYDNKIIEVPVIHEDWNLTNERFDGILKSKELTDGDRIKLLRLLNYNANRITDHFSERTLARMDAGRRAKMERTERAKNRPPVEVTISEALEMHEGNVRLRGMISLGSDKIEKMITRVFFRCGECDSINELKGYRDSCPMFVYEVPTFNLKDKRCMHGCEFGHELDFEVINAYRTELQEPETLNDVRMLESNNKNWSRGSAPTAEIHQNGGQYSSNTASKKSAMRVLKGNYRIARRALTATQRKQQQQQQERQLCQQGFEQEEIDDVLGFLDWLNEDEDEEHEKDMMERFPVADESEPFHMSILAQKAIKAEAEAEAEAEAGRML